MLSGEATNTNFIVFSLNRLGLEPTICCTRGEQANHYTTDEPTICCTRGEQANHYTTAAVRTSRKIITNIQLLQTVI